MALERKYVIFLFNEGGVNRQLRALSSNFNNNLIKIVCNTQQARTKK